MPNVERDTWHEFILSRTDEWAMAYTDDAMAYRRLSRNHEAVVHSTGEYVNGEAHTNGIESFWATLKRAYKGTYFKMSEKHLHRVPGRTLRQAQLAV